MTQNGPHPGHSQPRSDRDPDGGYAEPADPWSGQDAWPQSPAPPPAGGPLPGYGVTIPPQHGPPPWGPSQPAPRRGPGALMITLVVVLGLLVVAGLGTTVYLLGESGVRNRAGEGEPSSPVPAQPQAAGNQRNPTPSPSGAADARFVKVGQCIRNDGTEQTPEIKVVPCGEGTFQVLKRVDGRTTGEDDAKAKCAGVKGYSLWYFYDSELDALDFVLCLKPR